MKKIKVLIVDDHMLVREGLRVVLEAAGDIEVVGEAEDGIKAVQKTSKLQPDVVLMDVSMPGMDGVEATRQIRSKTPAPKVLVLSTYGEDHFVAKSMQSGATGYLVKQSAANELLKAVREASQGRPVFSAAVSSRLAMLKAAAAADQKPRQRPGNRLTLREEQVLQLIAKGHPNKQVADALNISIKTVEKHRQQVMDKLKIHEIAGLTRYACAEGVMQRAQTRRPIRPANSK